MIKQKVFEGNRIEGIKGVFPLTAENLLRVGLALSSLFGDLKREKKISVEDLNFVTFSLGAGFMAGGGTVIIKGEAPVSVKVVEKSKTVVIFEGLSHEEIKRLEGILFGRVQIPKEKGDQVGRVEYGY